MAGVHAYTDVVIATTNLCTGYTEFAPTPSARWLCPGAVPNNHFGAGETPNSALRQRASEPSLSAASPITFSKDATTAKVPAARS